MNQKKWRVASASATGLAHLNQNTECQDRLSWQIIETKEGEVLIAVVADGAGSTTEGQRGAEFACAFFVEQIAAFLELENAFVKSLTEDFGKHWILYFQQKIAELAGQDQKSARDFASTLVGAVIGTGGAAFYQIGDGGIVFSASGEKESYIFAIEPVESEYVNVTDFITDEAAAERLRFKFVEETVEDLILFSDGIFSVAVDYQSNRPHEPFLLPMIAPLRNGGDDGNGSGATALNEKLAGFLASPRINEKTDDDKTIILASRSKP